MAKKADRKALLQNLAVKAYLTSLASAGGTARARNLSKKRLTEIAVMGGKARAKQRQEASAA